MGSFSGLLTRRWTLKLAAFAVALLLWVAVRAEAPNRQELTGVPVMVDLEDPGWALVGEPMPTTVTVRFGGTSRDLLGMAVDRPSVVVPLAEVASPDTAVILRNQWVRIPDRPGVIVEDIQPSSIRLTLEPIERVEVPVALRLEGGLPSHLAMAAPPQVEPGTVRVGGPRSRVSRLDSIPLASLDLSQVSSSGRIPVEVQSEALGGLQVQPVEVTVALQVEDRIERMVSGVPVLLPETLRTNDDLRVLPGAGSVLLSGPRSIVERADPTLLELVVQLNAEGPPGPGNEGRFPVTLVGVPAFLTGEPQQSEVTVRNLAPLEP